jgi:hypothetical protein
VEPTTTDRVQRMIDAEAAERFPPEAVPRLMLLHHGDHPVIEPGELYLRVFPGQGGATRDAWTAEHFDQLEDFRARRLPEVKGFLVAADARDSGGLNIMIPDGISLLDPEEDEIARGLTRVPDVLLGPADLAILDTLITAGIAASRAEATRWARVFIEEAAEDPSHQAWHRDHEAMIVELRRELEARLPGASHLEFWFGENGRQGKARNRLGGPPDDPASGQDLTPVGIRLGPADLAMLDELITAGIAASRAEAVGWVLARIRERPAYARLSERARELDELKARF